MRALWLLLPFLLVASFVVWVGMDFLPLAIWNLMPLILAYAALHGAARKRGAARWRLVGFGVTATAITACFHVAWFVDWLGTASGSSTAGLGFVFIPIYAVILGIGAALLIVITAHAIRLFHQ